MLNSADSRQSLLCATETRPSCCRIENTMQRAGCSISMQGSAPRPWGNLWLRSSDFTPSRTQRSGEGWDLPGPAPRLQGNADALPSQVCSHTDSLAGNDRVKISVTPEGTRPVPAPWPCCGREMGHYPVQLAGQDGSPAAWAGMRRLCLLPLPLHSFPAARSVGWLPQQQLKPSACIQHVVPSLQRGGCACRGRLHCSS